MPPKNDFHNVELNTENADSKIASTQTRKQSVIPETEVRHDYEDVLNLIGFGMTQWIVLITAGLFLMMVINETMGISIINIASQCDFATSSVDKAILSTASFAGILVSSYFWGYFSDTIGRRTVLIYSTFGGNIASFISMFIPYYWIFVVLRFVVGLFIAGASSTTYAYLSEFFVQRHRPVVINYASMFVGIALAYFPGIYNLRVTLEWIDMAAQLTIFCTWIFSEEAVAWLVLTMDWSITITDAFVFRPWRLLIIFNILPGFIATLILLNLPESPKIYIALHKEEEALAAINWICMRNTGQNLESLKVYKLQSELKKEHENILTTTKTVNAGWKKMWLETIPLLKPPHVVNFLISCIIMCGLFLSSSGMGLWYPEIQNRVSSKDDQEVMTVCQVIDGSMHQRQNSSITVCSDSISQKSYIDSIIFGLSYIAGYIILGIVINSLGRKSVIIGSLCISALCGIALHWILEPIAIVVSFCLFLMLPGLCISVLSGAVVDLVPTHLRGKAVCICLMLGRSGSVIGSNIIGILLESYCSLTFSLFSGCVFVCAVLTFILPI